MSAPVFGDLLGVGACLVGSAFFSASETALTSLGRAKVKQLVDASGDPRHPLNLWLKEPNKVLTTVLIGNNIVNVTASALATSASQKLLGGGSAVPIAIGVMTLLLLTFGEITPKTIARANRERVGMAAMRLLRPLHILLSPFASLFVVLSRGLARLAGTSVDHSSQDVGEDYIEFLVELGGREGTISEERQGLLQSVFDYKDTIARAVMVPRTDTIGIAATATADEALDLTLKCGHSRLPVYADSMDNVLGIFHVKDLLKHIRRHGLDADFDVLHMARKHFNVPETKPISEVFAEMQQRRSHLAIVVDEFGGMAGIVTLEDILEEIVGEIRDEYDHDEAAPWTEVSQGVYRVEGRTNLVEVLGLFDVVADDEIDAESLGGLIAVETGSVAGAGTVVERWGLRFTVESADERRIHAVRVERVLVLEESDGAASARDAS